MKYFLTLLIAFAVCGAMFGVNILLQNICYKRKRFLLQGFCMPLVGLVLAVVMKILTGGVSFEFRNPDADEIAGAVKFFEGLR